MSEYTLDCLGEACPVPLMKTEKELEKLNVGDLLIVSIDHSCAITSKSKKWTTANGKL